MTLYFVNLTEFVTAFMKFNWVSQKPPPVREYRQFITKFEYDISTDP